MWQLQMVLFFVRNRTSCHIKTYREFKSISSQHNLSTAFPLHNTFSGTSIYILQGSHIVVQHADISVHPYFRAMFLGSRCSRTFAYRVHPKGKALYNTMSKWPPSRTWKTKILCDMLLKNDGLQLCYIRDSPPKPLPYGVSYTCIPETTHYQNILTAI